MGLQAKTRNKKTFRKFNIFVQDNHLVPFVCFRSASFRFACSSNTKDFSPSPLHHFGAVTATLVVQRGGAMETTLARTHIIAFTKAAAVGAVVGVVVAVAVVIHTLHIIVVDSNI